MYYFPYVFNVLHAFITHPDLYLLLSLSALC
jgi:hypothetical protein